MRLLNNDSPLRDYAPGLRSGLRIEREVAEIAAPLLSYPPSCSY